MKYLLVLAVVVIAIYLWRSNRRAEQLDAQADRARQPGSGAPRVPQAMTRCALCDTHLPASEAVVGRRGSYCSEVHRHEAEEV